MVVKGIRHSSTCQSPIASEALRYGIYPAMYVMTRSKCNIICVLHNQHELSVFCSKSFNAVIVKCIWTGNAHGESTSYRCPVWCHGTVGPLRCVPQVNGNVSDSLLVHCAPHESHYKRLCYFESRNKQKHFQQSRNIFFGWLAIIIQVLSSNSWDGRPFGHNRYGPKREGLCPFWEGGLGPHLTQCGWGRGLSPRQVSVWYTSSLQLQPFVHNTPTLHTDRQVGQDNGPLA